MSDLWNSIVVSEIDAAKTAGAKVNGFPRRQAATSKCDFCNSTSSLHEYRGWTICDDERCKEQADGEADWVHDHLQAERSASKESAMDRHQAYQTGEYWSGPHWVISWEGEYGDGYNWAIGRVADFTGEEGLADMGHEYSYEEALAAVQNALANLRLPFSPATSHSTTTMASKTAGGALGDPQPPTVTPDESGPKDAMHGWVNVKGQGWQFNPELAQLLVDMNHWDTLTFRSLTGSRQEANVDKSTNPHREAQLREALEYATPSEAVRITAELDELRHSAGLRREAGRSIDWDAAESGVPTQLPVHGIHTAASDWMTGAGVNEVHTPPMVKAAAKQEADRWLLNVDQALLAEPEELEKQALDHASIWSSQYPNSNLAHRSFVAAVIDRLAV